MLIVIDTGDGPTPSPEKCPGPIIATAVNVDELTLISVNSCSSSLLSKLRLSILHDIQRNRYMGRVVPAHKKKK